MFDQDNINDVIKKAKKIQDQMNQVQTSLNTIQAQGESGAGLVKIIINGEHNCIKTDIDISLLKKSEKNILEDLITAAFNDANRKINEKKKKKISHINPGLPFLKNMNFMI